MAMNVGELVATLDVDDKGYTRGLTTAATEAKVAAHKIEDHLDDVDAPAIGERTGNGLISGLLGAVDDGEPRLSSAGADAGGGISGGITKGISGISSNVYVMIGGVVAALALLPLAGAVAGTGLALGFGGAIAGVGLAAAAQSEEVQESFKDLKESVVSDLKAMAAPLEQTLIDVSEDIGELFDSLSPHLEDAFADMAPVLSDFSDELFDAFEGAGPVIDDATEAFNSLLEALGPELEGSLDGIWEALSDLFDTIEDNPEPFVKIITGALDLVAGLIKLVDWLSQAYVWIDEHIPGGLAGLLSPLILVTEAFRGAGEKGGEFTGAMQRMGGALSSAWEDIRTGAEDLWEAISPILEDLWEALSNSDVLETVRGWWEDIAEIIELGGELIGELMSAAAKVFTWIWENFGEDIIGFISGVWTTIQGIFNGALEIIKGILNTAIGIITGDWERAWEGIKQIGSGAWEAIKGIVSGGMQSMKSSISGALKLIGGIFSTAWETIKTGARSGWYSIKSTVTGLWDNAVSALRNKLWQFTAIGSAIVSGIVSGIYNAAGTLYNSLRGIAVNALSAAKEALGISSPSRVMRDEVGKWIPEGISAGLDLGQARLDRRVRRMADSMTMSLGTPPPPGSGADPRRPGGELGSAVNIENFHAVERMSAHDVGEALYGLVTARGY